MQNKVLYDEIEVELNKEILYCTDYRAPNPTVPPSGNLASSCLPG